MPPKDKMLKTLPLLAAAGMGAAQNFQTMPSTPGSGPLTGPNTPAHQRNPQAAQTMFNVSQLTSPQHGKVEGKNNNFPIAAPTQRS